MKKSNAHNPVHRIIDANANRAAEGLRVCEEVARFIAEDERLTRQLKNVRHAIHALVVTYAPYAQLLGSRSSLKDIGFLVFGKEMNRDSAHDIFAANIQRVKESLRVLEEFSKLHKKDLAKRFKRLRYRIYEIEKQALLKVKHL